MKPRVLHHGPGESASRRRRLLAALLALAPASVVVALLSGSISVPSEALWQALTGSHGDPLIRSVVLDLRLPRALTAFAVGGLLAVAGALMQVLLRNPLADPYVLGVSGGASAAAMLAMLAGLGTTQTTGCAFLGAITSMLIVFGLAHGRGGWTPSRLLLTGVVVASGWGAVISFILSVSPSQALPGMVFWLMGEVRHGEHPLPAIGVLLVGLAVSWPMARSLNLLARGELQASALGVPVSRLRLVVYVTASLLTAVAVTRAGSVGFVGLVVPHVWRLAAGYEHRWLLPAAALMGGSLLVIADTLARVIIAPQQLPVGVLTTALGVPLFLYLLRRGPL